MSHADRTIAPNLAVVIRRSLGAARQILSSPHQLPARATEHGSTTLRRSAAVASVFIAGLSAQCAGAQDSAEAAAGDYSLGEIVVTAQKRAENLQDVPIAVAAISEVTLASAKLDNATAMAEQIPGLHVNGVTGGTAPLYSLRGVSMYDYSLNQSSPVATYYDEVFKGNLTLQGVELYDLERVEVLAGPQGTLYGKNTTGGAINFIAKKPAFDTDGYLKIGYGNYDRREIQGAIGGGLVDQVLAARVSGTYTKADGWAKNVLPGYADLEGTDQWAIRAQLLFQPTDGLSMLLKFSRSRQRPQNFAVFAEVGPTGVGGPALGLGYFRTVDGTPNGTPLAWDEIAANFTPKRHQDTESWALTVNWDVSDALRVTSISSYDDGHLYSPEDSDGSPLSVIDTPTFGDTWQYTQDLRVTSSLEGPFNFIVGAYYQRESLHNGTELRVYHEFDPGGSGDVCLNFGAACTFANSFDQRRHSWAAYTDASYELSSKFTVRGGLRYNNDKGALRNYTAQMWAPDGTQLANFIPGDPVNLDATLSRDLHDVAWTGKIGVDYKSGSGVLVYTNYSRGYRSGAFNAAAYFSPDEATVVKPETIDSVELGIKSEWLDQRLLVNGAIFHYIYKNQQVLDIDPLTAAQPLVNLGKSRTTGAELQVTARPMRALRVNAGLVWLHARFKDATLSGISINGNQLPNAPNFSATLGTDLDLWRAATVVVTAHVDANYQSSQFFEPGNDKAIAQGAYATANARLALQSAEDRWEVAAWVRNLGDRRYRTGGINLMSGFGFNLTHRSMPRTYGIDATYRF